MNLLPRFYDIERGSIHIGDTNISDVSLKQLRNLISYVGQDLTLFNDTIKNNIAYGLLENKSFDQVVDAAKTANAYDFIEKFKDEFNTVVGDNGVLLSGGQRQRIAIALSLIHI